jgi:hypothetical protein
MSQRSASSLIAEEIWPLILTVQYCITFIGLQEREKLFCSD